MADVTVGLRWQGEGLRFEGGKPGGVSVVLDGDGEAGPSPVTTLLLGLGGCMAADVIEITQKMRLPVTSLELTVDGDRWPEPPRRLTAVRLRYAVGGISAQQEPQVWRAIELSREKYCSVLHSLRPDMALEIELERR